MAYNIPAVVVVATKQASGNVRFDLLDGRGPASPTGVPSSLGQVRFSFTMPSADVTSMNTTVNGGSAGTALTFGYAQDKFPNDYPDGYTLSV